MQDADLYYHGENPTLSSFFTTLIAKYGKSVTFVKIQIPTGIFRRIITLQVNRLWFNGVFLDSTENKDKLGKKFDKTAKDIATNAAIHGVCYGFWNLDNLTMFKALNFMPLLDERNGTLHAGVRFWQIDSKKPWVIQLFETDGWTEYSQPAEGGSLSIVSEKQPYKVSIRQYPNRVFNDEIVEGENYPGFPIIPMYSNTEHLGELTRPIKAKIDLFDMILTTFGDDVLRTKPLYWILMGMSGNLKHLQDVKETIEDLGIIAPDGDVNAKVETVDLPFRSTMEFLAELEKAIFRDAMVTNPQEITGGNLTATAINASYHAEKLKVSDMEWQAGAFVELILELIGVDNQLVKFKHETISNDMEITTRLNMYRELPLSVRLMLDPLFADDMLEIIMDAVEKETFALHETEPEEEVEVPDNAPSDTAD